MTIANNSSNGYKQINEYIKVFFLCDFENTFGEERKENVNCSCHIIKHFDYSMFVVIKPVIEKKMFVKALKKSRNYISRIMN